MTTRESRLHNLVDTTPAAPVIIRLGLKQPPVHFSSTSEGNALTQDQQFQKLRLAIETAREIWPDEC